MWVRFILATVCFASLILPAVRVRPTCSAEADPSGAKQTAQIVKTELPRVPPKSPEDSLATIRVQDNCRVELVAAEPH